MRIATWNVNSVRQRLDHLLAWLRETAPDVVCLQEIKCVDEQFPREAIEALGYNVVTHGQKTFNGVALLSNSRSTKPGPGWPAMTTTCSRDSLKASSRSSTGWSGSPASICPTEIRRIPRNIPTNSSGCRALLIIQESG